MLASRSIPVVRTQSPTASKSPLLNRPVPAVRPQSPAASKPPLLNRPVPAVNPQSPATSKPPLLNRPVPAVSPQPSTWTRQPKPAVSVASTPSSHFSARTGLGGSVNTEASAAGLSQPSQLSQPPVSTGPFASLAECVTAEKVTIYQCIQSLQYELRLLQDFSANEGSEEVFASFRASVASHRGEASAERRRVPGAAEAVRPLSSLLNKHASIHDCGNHGICPDCRRGYITCCGGRCTACSCCGSGSRGGCTTGCTAGLSTTHHVPRAHPPCRAHTASCSGCTTGSATATWTATWTGCRTGCRTGCTTATWSR